MTQEQSQSHCNTWGFHTHGYSWPGPRGRDASWLRTGSTQPQGDREPRTPGRPAPRCWQVGEGTRGAPWGRGAGEGWAGTPQLSEPTCLCPWGLCPGTSTAAAGLRLGLCRNLATNPRVPRQTFRSPRERVVVFDSCCVTFLDTGSLFFPTEPARSSGGESQCERWSRQASEHSPAETQL